MMIVYEILIICGYLFYEKIGFLLTLILSIKILTSKKTLLEKIISIMILTIPTYNVGFIGSSLHHALSWCNIFSYILLIYLINLIIKNKIKLSKNSFLGLILVITILLISCCIHNYTGSSLFDTMQILLMILPLIILFNGKEFFETQINDKTFQNWNKYTNQTMVATAICVFIQYLYYLMTNKTIGFVTLYPNRKVFDVLINAYSVLSLYLGIGVVININDFFNNGKIKSIIFAIICFLGIVINSSRTGLVACAIVIILLLPKGLKKTKKPLLSLLMIIIAICVGILGTNYMLESRHTALLDENRRSETYIYGIKMLTKNTFNIFFGAGISGKNYSSIMPHNFLLETLTTTGVICTFIVILWLIKLLKFIQISEYRYIVWHILIGSMFITNFPGNTFATIYFMIAILNVFYLERGKINERK